MNKTVENEQTLDGTSIMYISGPIAGNKSYLQDFKNAVSLLKEFGVENIINPAEVTSSMPCHLINRDDFREMAHKMLGLSQAIYMLHGWGNSRGAVKDLEYAKENGLKIFYQDDIERMSKAMPHATRKYLREGVI